MTKSNSWYENGLEAMEIQNYAMAILSFTHVIETKEDAGAYANRAYTYFQIRELEKAMNDYEMAIIIRERNIKGSSDLKLIKANHNDIKRYNETLTYIKTHF